MWQECETYCWGPGWYHFHWDSEPEKNPNTDWQRTSKMQLQKFPFLTDFKNRHVRSDPQPSVVSERDCSWNEWILYHNLTCTCKGICPWGGGEPEGSGAFTSLSAECMKITYRNTLTNKYGRAIRQFDVIWTALKCVFLYSPKSPFLQWSGRAKEEKSMCFPVLKQSNVRWCLQDAQLESEGCDSSRHLRSCLGTQTPGRTMRR